MLCIYQACLMALFQDQEDWGVSPSPLGSDRDPVTAAGCWAVSRSDECHLRRGGVNFLLVSPAVVTLEAVYSVWSSHRMTPAGVPDSLLAGCCPVVLGPLQAGESRSRPRSVQPLSCQGLPVSASEHHLP